MTATRFGTFEELLTVEPLRSVATRLRQVGLGPKKMSEGYCYVLPYQRWVNLGFYQGAALPGAEGLLAGTGARLRHVKVRSLEDASAPAVRALVVAALAERRAALAH